MAIRKVARYVDSEGYAHLTEKSAVIAEEKIVFMRKVEEALGIYRYDENVCINSLRAAANHVWKNREALAKVFKSQEWKV